jgi:hypothetical protein
MHGSVINVPVNVGWNQSIVPFLPHDGATIIVFLKWCFEYKSLYMSINVHPNTMMDVLCNLIETSLYKDLKTTIDHQ